MKYLKIFIIKLIALIIIFNLSINIKSLFAQKKESDSISLIIREDDMGITHSVNQAAIKSYKEGIARTVEVIVPAPWFPEAVKLLKENPGLDVGVHLALTSEWENIKWRPLTHSLDLTDQNGYFFPVIWPNKFYEKSSALLGHQFSLSEIEKEFRKQIEVAKANIPQLTHLSYHMGCSSISDEVKSLVGRLAKEYDLYIDMSAVKYKGYDGRHRTSTEKKQSFIKMLKTLKPGNTYLFIDHPAFDDKEMKGVYMKGYEDVAQDRQGVTDLFTDAEIKRLINDLHIRLISYADLKKAQK